MNREQIDEMWQKAMHQSIAAGEQFTRYHFYDLIASHVAEECAQIVKSECIGFKDDDEQLNRIAKAIRSLYKPTA